MQLKKQPCPHERGRHTQHERNQPDELVSAREAAGNDPGCGDEQCKVVGPNETDHVAGWLPRRFSERAIPLLICGDQATRTEDVDGDNGGTKNANDVAAHAQVWLAAAGVLATEPKIRLPQQLRDV